jgi:tetratricopeptide (TPR) repeat protein
MKARIIFSLAAVFILVGCATHSYAQPRVDYFQRGNSHYKKGDYDLAIRDLTEAIHLDPKGAGAYNNRGRAYRKKGEYDLAIRDFTEAIRLDPKLAAAYGNGTLGDVHWIIGSQ